MERDNSSTKNKNDSLSILTLLLILGIVIVIIIGAIIAHVTGVVTLPLLSNNAVIASPQVNTSPSLSEYDRLSNRDYHKLQDIPILLEAIKKYKEKGGGEGTYYPRTLLEVVPEAYRVRVKGLRLTSDYGYKQSEDGRNFSLQIILGTQEAYKEYPSAQIGKNTLRFTKDSPTFQNITLD